MSSAAGSELSRTRITGEGVVAGIHLAGSNAKKSAVVLLDYTRDHVSFLSLYEKIGSVGSLFSDERILNILREQGRISQAMVDCPVTEPPCVECERPVCPGVIHCDDVSVAMMMAIEQQRGRKGAHKLRPLNPQNQRLWDVMYARQAFLGPVEPSYSANMAPLVIRARTLQRRLRAVYPKLKLYETNVPILLAQLGLLYDGDDWGVRYRNFEHGRKTRDMILNSLTGTRLPQLTFELAPEARAMISSSVEGFHAFMTAAMAVWRLRGLALPPTPFFEEQPGWVEMIQSEHVIKSL